MTLAIAYNPAVDPYASWQAANGAAWCQRLAALLSIAACKQNQKRTGLDCRCDGCGGLDNQVAPQQRLSLVLSTIKTSTTEPDMPSGSPPTVQHYEEPDNDFDDVEIELEDEELLALFPELDEDPWPDYVRFSEYQEEAPRRAVYRGRCNKCGGYMEDTRERRDDNVFRCFACGWRTSPEYERNRAIHAVGGII